MKWPRVPIGDLCLPTETKDPRDEPEQPFLYVDIASIDRKLKTIGAFSEILGAEAPSRARKRIQANDILVSTVRPNLNAVAIVLRELDGQVASTGFCVLRPQPDVLHHKFLFYFAVTPEFVDELSSRVRGAHYPAVSDGDVKKLAIPLPSPSEQRRIVEILDQADALRKKRAEADAKAARILPALFYKMFGDPATNPKGWPVRPLGDLIQFGPQNGLYKPATDYGTGTPILRIDSFDDGVIRSDQPLKRVRLRDAELSTYGLRVDDIVINRVNSPELLGKSTLIEGMNEPTVFESNMMRLAVNPAVVRPSYIIHLLQTRAAKAFLLTRSKRAVNQASINQDDVRALPVPVPPPPKQVLFEDEWRNATKATSHPATARVRLDNLFRVLSLRAYEGSLTARWREAHMKELLAEMEAQARILEAVR